MEVGLAPVPDEVERVRSGEPWSAAATERQAGDIDRGHVGQRYAGGSVLRFIRRLVRCLTRQSDELLLFLLSKT